MSGLRSNYCNKPPRCVKCAGKHSSTECTVEIPYPKCCNCDEQHPASYRGCVVAKELQKLRNQKISRANKAATTKTTNAPVYSNTNIASNPTRIRPITIQSTSYTNAIKTTSSDTSNDILSQILQRLWSQEEFFKTIDLRLTRLEQISFN